MTGTSTLPAESQRVVLEAVCECYHTADLVWERPGVPKEQARVRFLAYRDEELVIDRPTVKGQPLALAPGDEVQIYFAWEGQRFAFASQVRGRTLCTHVGALPVPGLLVDAPLIVKRTQRREAYRLSTMHLSSARVRLTPRAENRPPIEGVLLNLSETGCCARLACGLLSSTPEGKIYEATFDLLDGEGPFCLEAELQWQQDDEDGKTLRVGFAWRLDENERTDQHIQQRLGKFIIAEQQRQLRRVRMRGQI